MNDYSLQSCGYVNDNASFCSEAFYFCIFWTVPGRLVVGIEFLVAAVRNGFAGHGWQRSSYAEVGLKARDEETRRS